jgi:HAD superfamily hydrolase (TIGR01509 family)
MIHEWTPRGVVFDFDGVLADTEGLHLAAFQDVFAARGWQLDERAYFDRYLGFDDRGLIDAYAADHSLRLGPGDRDAVLAAKTAAFQARFESGDVLYPGARACVERLAPRFRLAVATGALRAEVLAILTTAGVLPFFHAIVAADDVPETKPDPEPYLAAAARMGLMPSECAAIEDSRWGLASARAAGMRTIGITTTTPRDLLAGADLIVEILDEITADVVASLAGGRTA